MRVIDVIAPAGQMETILSVAEKYCTDHWVDPESEDGRKTVHLLVDAANSQKVIDGLQVFLGSSENTRIVISAIEATLPVIEEAKGESKAGNKGVTSSREELLSDMEKRSRLDMNFLILVVLSTIVAAVGLIKDNVAVVIGAMVIAPLLGPNLSLALGTALGEKHLMWRSVKTNLAGVGVTLMLSLVIGLLWPVGIDSRELLARTDVGLDSIALALASGAAGVLSITTGLSSVLVGVMVAVALMPPAVTLGLMLSSGQYSLAFGALMLLAVNVVCLNFAANVVFFAKGVSPRTWHEKKKARRSIVVSIVFWAALLAFLLLWLTMAPAYAAEPTEPESSEERIEEQANTEQPGAGEETHGSLLDAHKEYIDSRVERASAWVDGFFDDPSYEAESAYSQIRIRPEFYYRQEQGASGRLKVRARFNLPNLGRRVSLVAGADDEDGRFDEASDDSVNESAIGLQFFLKETSRWNASISTGIKFNEFAAYVGPRVRFQDTVGEKGSYRFTQTLRWLTNNTSQINSRLDLNRILNSRWFFRQTFDGRWRGEDADEEGYRTQISSFLTQRLGKNSGLQYEFSTVFHTRPDTHVDKYTLALRYRKRTSRDWLYYEIVPQVSFEDKYDFKFNPGIRLRVEFFYGKAAKRFWRRESEDTSDFRW